MPSSPIKRAIDAGASRVPGLRRLPVLKVLAAAEVLVLARDHMARLEPAERRRLVELVRIGRGRRSNLTDEQRAELTALIKKADPRAFLGDAANRLSPVPLPSRFLYGRR